MVMAAKGNDILRYLISLAIVLLLGFLSSLFFAKWDLTEEKRHSLTSATIEMLESIDDVVFIRVYLSGEYPAQYKRLEKAVRERLDEFNDYSDGLVQYEFIDPYASSDKKTSTEVETTLLESGLQFSRLAYEEGGVQKYKLIWPGAIINYKGKESAIQFLKSENPVLADEMVNASVNNLEYELSGKLRQILRVDQPKIAILEGHRELPPIEMIDFEASLAEQYVVNRMTIGDQVNALSTKVDGMANRVNEYDLLIVAKPLDPFSNKEKVVIDQFIMNGGKVIWMVDPLFTDLDSLRNQQQTLAIGNEMGLYDMLFEYGVRLNRDMVIDYQCAPIAFDAGPMGNQRNMQLHNWYYAPIIIPADSTHPIVNNLDPIALEFASSLDPVGDDFRVRKTPLLKSSEVSKRLKSPVRVNTSIVNFDVNYFRNSQTNFSTCGMLLEGIFNSNFTHRLPDTLKNAPEFAFRAESVPTKMVVIADGDIGRNRVMNGAEGPVPVPLGYSRYAGRVIYDNKEFLLNTVNYLLDDEALISVRSRTIKLRKLNEDEILENRSRWQMLNVVLPLLILIIFGVVRFWMRKRKFGGKNKQ